MANEIQQANLVPASTYYAVGIRAADGDYLNTTGPAFEVFNAAHWANYAIGAGTPNAAGRFIASVPAGTPAASISWEIRAQAGGSPADTDGVVGVIPSQGFYWNGTAVYSLAGFNNTGQVAALPTTGGITGIAQGGTPTSITLSAGDTAANGVYVGQTIYLIAGTGIGQVATITAYVASMKVATVTTPYSGGTWLVTPTNTTTYELPGTIQPSLVLNYPLGAGVNEPYVVRSNIAVFQNSAMSFQYILIDANSNPINLAGKTVSFVAFTSPDGGQTQTVQFVYDNASNGGVTVTGSSSNIVTVTFSTTNTASLPEINPMKLTLWNITDSLPLVSGDLKFIASPISA